MQFALINDIKTKPAPNLKGVCPICEMNVHSKCGDINIWHWSHDNLKDCDAWSEGETQWHLDWKAHFGKEYQEVTIEKDGVVHRADVQNKNGIIIELQHSPLSNTKILEREKFYGEKLIWVIDGTNFRERFEIWGDEWRKAPHVTNLFDFDLNQLKGYEGVFHGSIKPNDKFTLKKPSKGLSYNYIWKHSKRSWREAKNPIFIDFGGDYLFWIKDYIFDINEGRGQLVLKSNFINKYK